MATEDSKPLIGTKVAIKTAIGPLPGKIVKVSYSVWATWYGIVDDTGVEYHGIASEHVIF